VDVDSGELLALEASYERSCLNALIISQADGVVDRGPWYRWALQRLGLEYKSSIRGTGLKESSDI
jgi:hypothetical protein